MLGIILRLERRRGDAASTTHFAASPDWSATIRSLAAASKRGAQTDPGAIGASRDAGAGAPASKDSSDVGAAIAGAVMSNAAINIDGISLLRMAGA